MSPGAGAELKHLMSDVKSKTTKPEGLYLKPKGNKAETLDINDKGIDLKAETLNLKALGDAIKGAKTGNRQTVAVWSPKISAILWYLKKTTPEFSISDEARIILEEGLERKYPELFQRVKEEMSQS
jgi:hypothetical protein